MKKLYIHILNIVALVLYFIFNAFAYLGMNFTVPTEPYTAEYTFLGSFYVLLGAFYYLQIKYNSIGKFLIIIVMEVVFLYVWGLNGQSLLEPLLE
ncbi:hypothetical protein [Halobacillus salinus]|uniref:Uncharacterized protein n=1 Tax=Halobacillus salinus TaxID=192814 RepID=A0A4Z0H1C5_9BACI|nr:hypothetical protein [Halobacillus salinus]TGB03657.1 hypothetical protein E4663_01240 [Halobacillus salinus]